MHAIAIGTQLPDPSENSIEEVKQLIETFNAGLLQWKRNEQLKEQDIRPDIEAFNQNLLNRLENLSDTIVENLIVRAGGVRCVNTV